MLKKVWVLRSADKRNLSLIPHDLNYFQTHFIGKSMLRNWEPPPIRIDGSRLKLRDFVSWMIQAPVVSARAKSCLEVVFGNYVEFLPLTEIRGTSYFALNVVKIVDCLNRDKSEILFSPDCSSRILDIKAYCFVLDRIVDVPIFKIPDYPFTVFATQLFVEKVIQNRLTGAKFGDPGANPWIGIAKSHSSNMIPGVLD